jgi:hypothetical protein
MSVNDQYLERLFVEYKQEEGGKIKEERSLTFSL